MSVTAILGFYVIVGIAAYVQSLTGFAFGLLVMGTVGLSGLMPLPEAAVIVGFLTLINATQMVAHGYRNIARRELGLVLAASLPSLAAGYALLTVLSASNAMWIRLLLGLVIIASSLQLVVERRPRATCGGPLSFLGFGALSGLLTGLFSTGGPPLVYHFYRQPLAAAAIRDTLVATFGAGAIIRLSLVVSAGNLPSPGYLPCVLAAPIVMGATWLARRHPPPLSPTALRRLVLVLLLLSGVALAAPSLPPLLALLATSD